ncbi:BlaI/MecI/CopY family transcriptional regulator [Limnochorda pilosa]|uniref:Transcriptional regulator n=1 Tax=Limnochorda pilosa TaxID=1555112 RepID=A0A0K2SJ73_LIMPI|nr:BlaI/MecI/CopY family transcriptional regulator [Limnochorda pilosa]BAS26894.1 transcriptional regulator [Limnochorda pilosa]
MPASGPDRAELGPLEAEVMRAVWDLGEVQVEDVHRRLREEREIAYTTVMTVMARLAEKGFLKRRKDGRAYVYRARVAREQAARGSLRQWVQRYWGEALVPAVSMLLGGERLRREDVEALRRLIDSLAPEEGPQHGDR